MLSHFELRHSQSFPALLPFRQRGDFRGQRVDVLLIAHIEGVAGQVHAGLLIVGFPVIAA